MCFQIGLPGDLINIDEDIDPAAKRILNSLASINEFILKNLKYLQTPGKKIKRSKVAK